MSQNRTIDLGSWDGKERRQRNIDLEVRVLMLENERERIFNHHKEIKISLAELSDKLNILPCISHAGEFKVFDEKFRNITAHLCWMWAAVAMVMAVIVGVAVKSYAGG